LAKSLRRIYQLKVALQRAKPPIWRRFLIDSTVTLEDLHEALQIVMGWTDSHLHQFIADGCCYGVPNPEWDFEEIVDEKTVRLNRILVSEKDSMTYEYDFGDGWVHKITLEKILPFDPNVTLPVCVKAKGACPPEDVGGLWGYYRFLEALKDPNHEEHEEFREWIDGDFDPDAYDIEQVNQLLVECFRP
jgi:hypothetical protein